MCTNLIPRTACRFLMTVDLTSPRRHISRMVVRDNPHRRPLGFGRRPQGSPLGLSVARLCFWPASLAALLFVFNAAQYRWCR